MTSKKLIPALLVMFPTILIVTSVIAHFWWKHEREAAPVVENAPFAASLREEISEVRLQRHVDGLASPAYLESTLSMTNSGYALETTLFGERKSPLYEINLPGTGKSRDKVLISVSYEDRAATAAVIGAAKSLAGSEHARHLRFVFLPGAGGADFYANRCLQHEDRFSVILCVEGFHRAPEILADPESARLQDLALKSFPSALAAADPKRYANSSAALYHARQWPALLLTDAATGPQSLEKNARGLESVILRFADPD